MAENILTRNSKKKAKAIRYYLIEGYVPFFTVLLAYGSEIKSILDKIKTTDVLLKSIGLAETIAKQSTVDRANNYLAEIEKAKNEALKDKDKAETIRQSRDLFAILPEELTVNPPVSEKRDKKTSRSEKEGFVEKSLHMLGIGPRSAIGIGLGSQIAAPLLGPAFGAVTALSGLGLLARKPAWAITKGLLKAVPYGARELLNKNRRQQRRTQVSDFFGRVQGYPGRKRQQLSNWWNAPVGASNVNYDDLAGGMESFADTRAFNMNQPLAGLAQATAPSPQSPATDLSSAGRMLAAARWGKKGSITDVAGTNETAKGLEFFFDKRAYKAKWTRDLIGYVKKIAGGRGVEENGLSDFATAGLFGAIGGVLSGFLGDLGTKIGTSLISFLKTNGLSLGVLTVGTLIASYLINKTQQELTENALQGKKLLDDASENISKLKPGVIKEQLIRENTKLRNSPFMRPEASFWERWKATREAVYGPRSSLDINSIGFRVLDSIPYLIESVPEYIKAKKVFDEVTHRAGKPKPVPIISAEEAVKQGFDFSLPKSQSIDPTVYSPFSPKDFIEVNTKQKDLLIDIKNVLEKLLEKSSSHASYTPNQSPTYDSMLFDPLLLDFLNYNGSSPIGAR